MFEYSECYIATKASLCQVLATDETPPLPVSQPGIAVSVCDSVPDVATDHTWLPCLSFCFNTMMSPACYPSLLPFIGLVYTSSSTSDGHCH
ncbi:hypothetical protein BAUCODRAFT_39790 [Baudoinia panamericana UAMH 10762]|uniref:Uncharacterized protein n=1 Tax=Baudoinia panamericana (strain UAMH 10762) TaxID=717646 RepID=M2LB14_BAUPA|nr:uncharacterized protein BAUCODRAFT_39790 [Baudoinia panamericana UAMH 10762]EMC90992.1 hypothetical protein BAUCODRAFT_39790 [Baudoinia panamericana UAMH 10762]